MACTKKWIPANQNVSPEVPLCPRAALATFIKSKLINFWACTFPKDHSPDTMTHVNIEHFKYMVPSLRLSVNCLVTPFINKNVQILQVLIIIFMQKLQNVIQIFLHLKCTTLLILLQNIFIYIWWAANPVIRTTVLVEVFTAVRFTADF